MSNKAIKTGQSINKSNKTNIILSNLSVDKLTRVLELCEQEGIKFTFDKDYYSNEYYDIYSVLDDVIFSKKKVPNVYQKIIENEYKDYIEDLDDYKNKEKILEKIENIVYEK